MSTVSAAQAVGEFLQSPDDLLKVAAFRKKLAKEKASIDAKLKSGVKDQLDATRDGLRKLFGTRENIQAIKDEMVIIDKGCSDPQHQIPTFDQITRVSIVHRNFALAEEMVFNLTEMYSKLDTLEDQLAQDRDDILGPAPHLLIIHHQLNQLEGFRNETMHQAKRASADARSTLERHFERLNRVIKAFDEYIFLLASNILGIVRQGHTSVIVRMIKIAEIEGREDEKAVAIKMLKKAAKFDAASKFRSMQANARTMKHYRHTIMSRISESIKRKFEDARNDSGDPELFFERLSGWMYPDLVRISDDVIPCFPPDYDIYAFFVKNYHKALNETVKAIVASEPPASILLTIHAWQKQYKRDMQDLEIPVEWLTPPILDGKEQSLIEDYVKLIIQKLDEWTANLMKTETQDFVAREQELEVDENGLYRMQGSVILFQMVNQQVDLAIESSQGGVLARVVTECSRVMRQTQDQWTKLIDAELKKSIEKPEEATGGLVEYVMALANDQIRSADFAEALSNRLEELVSSKYKSVINEQLNEAIDGYLDVAKKCTQVLIDAVFNDLKPATKQLFQPTWYDGIMTQIIVTMGDYLADYQTFLNPNLFEIFLEDVLDTFILTYLTSLRRCPKLRMPAASDMIRADIDEAFQFFSTYKSAGELEAYFEVVEMLLSLLTASKSLVFLSYWPFAQKHGPNLSFVEHLMKSRDDLDRTAVGEVMESVRRKVKEDNIQDPEVPSILKRVVTQNVMATFLSAVGR